MILSLFRRKPTEAERIAAASAWIDADRARRIAAMDSSHRRAALKGWSKRKGVAERRA